VWAADAKRTDAPVAVTFTRITEAELAARNRRAVFPASILRSKVTKGTPQRVARSTRPPPPSTGTAREGSRLGVHNTIVVTRASREGPGTTPGTRNVAESRRQRYDVFFHYERVNTGLKPDFDNGRGFLRLILGDYVETSRI
jgi:hypothetical protein